MGRNTGSKCKQCRREKDKLFLKGDRCSTQKCSMVRRNYAPGQHGQTSGLRLSEYGVQLREKQKAKKIFGLREAQFRQYVQKAMRRKGVTGEIMLRALEKRLDNVVFRLGIATSRAAARQLVRHGHFKVNDQKVSIPSYMVKAGDQVTIKESHIDKQYFKEAKKSINPKSIPSWLSWDGKKMTAKIENDPPANELEMSIKSALIVEFYSR